MNRFYDKDAHPPHGQLSEDESKHCLRIFRQQAGDQILVMDGKGAVHLAVIAEDSKKTCRYTILSTEKESPKDFSMHLAIAPTKNAERMEWLIEKLTEMSVDQVTFLITEHSERKKLRIDRIEKKAISALKQSGNPYLPVINHHVTFREFLNKPMNGSKFIAHVDRSHTNLGDAAKSKDDITLLIGPEGDFTHDEITAAIEGGYTPVSLGINTLRTETAGLVACSQINLINRY